MYFEGGITVELQKGSKEGEGEKAFLPLFLSSFFLCLFDLVLRGEEEKKVHFSSSWFHKYFLLCRSNHEGSCFQLNYMSIRDVCYFLF